MNDIPTAHARCKHGMLRYPIHDQFVGRSLEIYGEYSDVEAGLLQQLVQPGNTVVEVGANIGALTVVLSKAAGDGGLVIALEPQPEIAELLLANVALNHLKNVDVLLGVGAGAAAEIIEMPAVNYAAEGNFGAVELGEGTRSARIVTIDSLKLQALHLLKIDVEGMEAAVIEGARETIKRLRPVLYVENDRADKSAALIEQIQALGYRLWWHLPPLFNPKNERGCRLNVFPGIVSVNMLCVPAEVKSEIALHEITDPHADWRVGLEAREFVKNVPAAGQKRCAVVRMGAYGDILWGSSVLPHLKAEGYHVTVYTDGHGEEILRCDPHVDRIVNQEHVEAPQLQQYWDHEAKQYDRFINLTESVEKNLLGIRSDLRFYWPAAMRRKIFGGNYIERVHALADVPMDFRQRFFASPEEIALSVQRHSRFDASASAVIVCAGSTPSKFWPHVAELVRSLVEADVHVTLLGETRELEVESSKFVDVVGTSWPIREAIAFAQLADVVIGQETGILNAVAMEPMRKIVLLSHSTPENLTKHWINTVPVIGEAPCWPCHRVQLDFTHCTQDKGTGAALCQASIPPWRVSGEVLDYLESRLAVAA